MTSRLRIGVLKGRPAAMIFAILCAVIVFAGGPTKALAIKNHIVKVTTYMDSDQCDNFFYHLLLGNLEEEERCISDVPPECHRRLSSSENIGVQTVRMMINSIISDLVGFSGMQVDVVATLYCWNS